MHLAEHFKTGFAYAASVACIAGLFSFTGPAMAEDTAVSPELTARMAKEKEDRKACKIEICKAFAQPADGPAITCTVIKTWLGSEIQAGFLGDKLTWPWGHAQCSAAIDLDRKAIAEAATKPSATLKLKKHSITCKLDHKDPKEGTVYDLKLSIEPNSNLRGRKSGEGGDGVGHDRGAGPRQDQPSGLQPPSMQISA